MEIVTRSAFLKSVFKRNLCQQAFHNEGSWYDQGSLMRVTLGHTLIYYFSEGKIGAARHFRKRSTHKLHPTIPP